MIFGVIIDLVVGAVCIVPGLLLWRKHQLSILHEYHYKNVKEEDIPAYTRMIGAGLIIMGIGIIITGVLEIMYSSFWWIPLIAGLVLGAIVMFAAQKKYNGSVMG